MRNATPKPTVPSPDPQPSPHYDAAMFAACLQHLAVRLRDERGRDRLDILEAGCGRRWSLGQLDVPGVRTHLTGVDANAESLRIRVAETGDLDEMVVGDLRTVELPPAGFDAVYCSWVLEHVAGAEAVLDRLVAALRPGGALLLRIPDRDSVYGFVTRLAPFPLHVAYKRYVRGRRNAGRPGYGPFPTVYDRVVSHRGIHAYCARTGLVVESCHSSNFHLEFFGRFAPAVDRMLRVVAALSFGRLTAEHNNLAFVIRKPAAPAPPASGPATEPSDQ